MVERKEGKKFGRLSGRDQLEERPSLPLPTCLIIPTFLYLNAVVYP